MVEHDVEAHLLEVKVGIGVDEGVSTQLNAVLALLHKVLLQSGGRVGGIVAAKPSHVVSDLYT